ncbi:MAG: DUF1761 domain-containing protein [Patescibacteria group bacterium]
MFTLIDPWAVLVAAVVAYVIGWAWYSPLLWGKPWNESRGNAADAPTVMSPRILLYGFVNTLLMSFVIAVMFALVDVFSLVQSLQVALLMCFGFIVTLKFNELIYTNTPPHWGRRAQLLFLIDSGYYIAVFLAVATVLWYLP